MRRKIACLRRKLRCFAGDLYKSTHRPVLIYTYISKDYLVDLIDSLSIIGRFSLKIQLINNIRFNAEPFLLKTSGFYILCNKKEEARELFDKLFNN